MEEMMFRDKEYVYEVWRERSFTKAAAKLYISQPSLSAKIKKIEDEIGAPIFDRSTAPLGLTEFGETYIQAITEVREIERKVENYVNDMNMLHSGTLSIGASNVFAAYAIPPLITPSMYVSNEPPTMIPVSIPETKRQNRKRKIPNSTGCFFFFLFFFSFLVFSC